MTIPQEGIVGPSGLDPTPRVGELDLMLPVWVEPTTSVQDTARRMVEAGVTAALVRGEELGIVTDRDMRAKAVAAGHGPDLPVAAITSSPAVTIDADVSMSAAFVALLSTGHHHLPVTTGGRVIGVLSDLALLRREQSGVFRIRAEVSRARDGDRLAEAMAGVPDAVTALVDAGVDAAHVAAAMSALIDAVTRRLTELAEGPLGPAPADWAWLALGSSGREEPTLSTDQDHALIYADHAGDDYFAEMAAFVVDGLERCGIRRCPLGVMADRSDWRGSVDWWMSHVTRQMGTAAQDDAFAAETALDGRQVAGPLNAAPILAALWEAASGDLPFHRTLSDLAGGIRVPGRWSRQDTIDLKQLALMPITELARLLALESGARARSTPHRLARAAAAGLLDADAASSLEQAFYWLQHLRLEHHLACHRAGIAPDDVIEVSSLTGLDQRRLRDVLSLIRAVQREVHDRYLVRVRLR